MEIKFVVAVILMLLAWAAWPSQWVRERGRQAAIGVLLLFLVSALGTGVAQLVRPDLAVWIEHPAVLAWWEQQIDAAASLPVGTWWLLGTAFVAVILLRMLYGQPAVVDGADSRRRSWRTRDDKPQRDVVTVSVRGSGGTDLQRALDALRNAQGTSLDVRERRVEELLPHR